MLTPELLDESAVEDISARWENTSGTSWHLEDSPAREAFGFRVYDNRSLGICRMTRGDRPADAANSLAIKHAKTDIPALCATVKQLRADLKYRCEALEELRRCRDRWLTMLNPASADETVDGAIRNLQQAYISERDNAADLQSQLEQLRAENERLRQQIQETERGDFDWKRSRP